MNVLRILIVEDEQVCLDTLRHVFTSHKFVVIPCTTAEQALRFLASSEVDAVLTDIKLPGMSGIQLLQQIRKKNSSLPVVIVTGFASLASAVEALKLGAHDYIMKPIQDTRKLVLTIKGAIEHYNLRKENERLIVQLADREKTLQMLFDNASDMIFLHELPEKGRSLPVIKEANSEVCRRLEYSHGALEKMTFLEVVADDRRDETAKYITQLSRKLRLIYETVFVSGDGEQIPVEVMSHAFEYGKKRMVLSIARDISRRREMELKVAEACENERAELAREIHDVLCQELTGSNMIMSCLKMIIAKDMPDSLPMFEKLEGAVGRMMATARKISTGLYPAELKKDGFANAVENFLLGQETLRNIKFVFKRDARFVDPKRAAGLNIYRIVQEAIYNSIKHGKCSKITVQLARRKDFNEVTVEDNGVGVDQKSVQEGMGMSIIRHRALIAGATLKVESAAGKGYRVICLWK